MKRQDGTDINKIMHRVKSGDGAQKVAAEYDDGSEEILKLDIVSL